MKKIYLLPILSGILLGINYPPYHSYFIWFALIPFLYFLTFVSSWKSSFFAGWLTGMIFLGIVFIWLFKVYPLDWLNIDSKYAIILIFLIWLINTSFLALFIAGFATVYHFLKSKNFLNILIIPCLWVIFEYLRAWGFGLFWLGSSSLLGPHWTMGNLGYAITDNQILIQLAGFGGIYFLSFLLVFINALLFFILSRIQKSKKYLFLFMLVILCLVLTYISGFVQNTSSYTSPSLRERKNEWEREISKGREKTEKEMFSVALIQTNFPAEIYSFLNIGNEMEIFATQLNLMKQISKSDQKPKIIFLPEGANFLDAFDELGKEFIQKNFNQENTLIVDYSVDCLKKNNLCKPNIIYFDSKKGILHKNEKLLLMPGGEYLPYWFEFVLENIGLKNWLRKFYELRTYQKGEKSDIIYYENLKIGGLLCSGIVSPNLYRKLTHKGAEVLFNSASESVFHNSKTIMAQNLSMAKIRAVENRRYFIKTTNCGWSYIINPYGKIVKISKKLSNKVVNGYFVPIKTKTFYSKYGDWIIFVSTLFIFLVCLQKYSIIKMTYE